MDTIVDKLSSSLVVTPVVASDGSDDVVTRQSRYKNHAKLADSQANRRADHLDRQKRERDGRLDGLRTLTAIDDGEDEDAECMDATVPAAFRYKKKEYYASRHAHQLMFSEWMEETPDDLGTNWLFKMCPRGKRCLVVARRRCTRSYSAAGALLRTFPSHLPAGCRGPIGQRPTLLDCIWDADTGTFHVLDLLCWNGHEIFDCDTDFRFAWLLAKLAETPDVGGVSRRNPYRFCALPHNPATSAAIAAAAAAHGATADGALFFHRAARYRSGCTPLVLWLKPFMLPEAVGLAVPAAELGAPADYAGRTDYVGQFEERRRTRQKRHHEKDT